MSSGCGDVLSLADLQTAKKHQIFEAEVITGKSGGVAGGADIDYATNQVTGQTQKTLPAVLRDAGFSPVSWDFSTGGTLTVNDRDKVVYDPVSKTWYSYAGTLPVVVPASFNPVGNADWQPQTYPNLQSELDGVMTLVPDSYFEAIKASYNGHSTPQFTIATWNLQTYEVVNSRYNRNPQDSTRFRDLSAFINTLGASVVCTQEVYNGPSAHMNNLAVGPFNDGQFFYSSDAADTANLMIGYRFGVFSMANLPLTETTTIKITDEGGYVRLAGRCIYPHGTHGNIVVYNVHGSWYETGAAALYSAIKADYTALGLSKIVITGDFNHDTTETWFSTFTSDGFTVVNNMQYDTRNDGGGAWYIDNVIVKGLSVGAVSVVAPEQSLSDHKALCVTLY